MSRRLEFLVPLGVDDPATPSGGNTYDRRLTDELERLGWQVGQHPVSADLGKALAGLVDGDLVLIDGLVGLSQPQAVADHRNRLRIVVLLHMPFGERDPANRAAEHQLLDAAAAVLVSSRWARDWLTRHYPVPNERIRVAEPGTDPAPAVTPRSADRLLCLAAVIPDKGQHVLVESLAGLAALPWRLTCAGTLARDPAYAEEIGKQVAAAGLTDRVHFPGPLTGRDRDRILAETDLMVLATRAESWGMALTEAIARGIPVVCSAVGGTPEAVAEAGLLVPADDAAALRDALRRWLTEPALRDDLRAAARARASRLRGWTETAADIDRVLSEVSG